MAMGKQPSAAPTKPPVENAETKSATRPATKSRSRSRSRSKSKKESSSRGKKSRSKSRDRKSRSEKKSRRRSDSSSRLVQSSNSTSAQLSNSCGFFYQSWRKPILMHAIYVRIFPFLAAHRGLARDPETEAGEKRKITRRGPSVPLVVGSPHPHLWGVEVSTWTSTGLATSSFLSF